MSPAPEPTLALVAYRSIASVGMSDVGCEKLMRQVLRNNQADGLTGFLSFEKGEFRQVLEGRPERISKRMADILGDPRHCDVQITRYTLGSQRRFDTWRCIGFPQHMSGYDDAEVRPRDADADADVGDLLTPMRHGT